MHETLVRLYAIAQRALSRPGLKEPTELADLLGESPQTVNNWATRGVSLQGALKAEALWGYPALAILGEIGGIRPRWLDTDQAPRKLLAHEVGLALTTIPPAIKWGELMTVSLPNEFETLMPDDSMSPRIKSGHTMRFCIGMDAKPGDAVLICDGTGAHYVRMFRQRRPGHWEAYALNSDHPALDSTADGLTVVAVLVGVLGRWG